MAHWTLQSNVADVLSLGPRTAGRLQRLGVRTAGELLAAKPQAIVVRLRDERFTVETVADWQREARLLIEAPALPAEGARLLAAIGFASAERVARATPTELLAAIEQFTQDQQRAGWLATKSFPSADEVNRWIHCAHQSLAPRAA